MCMWHAYIGVYNIAISFDISLRNCCADPGSDQCGGVSETHFAAAVVRVRYPERGGLGRLERHVRR